MAQIYELVCIPTQKRYIGCTKVGEKALKKRMREHRCLLKKGAHSEKLLQADWDMHGEVGFAMLTLARLPEDCSIADKRTAEKRWMEYYKAKDRLYNTNLASFEGAEGTLQKRVEAARRANKGRVHTPEERLKRSISNKGKHTGHGHKISATKKALGQQPTREAIEKSVLNRQIRAAKKRAALRTDDVC